MSALRSLTTACARRQQEMTIVLRPGTAADAPAGGNICYEAFRAIATAHNIPPDFPHQK